MQTAKPWRGQTADQLCYYVISSEGHVDLALQVDYRYQNAKAIYNIASSSTSETYAPIRFINYKKSYM